MWSRQSKRMAGSDCHIVDRSRCGETFRRCRWDLIGSRAPLAKADDTSVWNNRLSGLVHYLAFTINSQSSGSRVGLRLSSLLCWISSPVWCDCWPEAGCSKSALSEADVQLVGLHKAFVCAHRAKFAPESNGNNGDVCVFTWRGFRLFLFSWS